METLEKNKVVYEEAPGRLSKKFVMHAEELIKNGKILGPCPRQQGLGSLGLKVGQNRNAVIVNNGPISLVNESPAGKRVASWAFGIIAAVIATVVGGYILSLL